MIARSTYHEESDDWNGSLLTATRSICFRHNAYLEWKIPWICCPFFFFSQKSNQILKNIFINAFQFKNFDLIHIFLSLVLFSQILFFFFKERRIINSSRDEIKTTITFFLCFHYSFYLQTRNLEYETFLLLKRHVSLYREHSRNERERKREKKEKNRKKWMSRRMISLSSS